MKTTQFFLRKTLQDIPTLKSYPLIGHTYLFFPKGSYSADRLTEFVLDISKQLGPIFRLSLGGTNIVITTDADYAETLFRNEGARPRRPSFPALYYFRKRTFNSVGVVPGNGEEWYKYRSGVTPLLKRNVLEFYVKEQKNVAHTFVSYIINNCDSKGVLNDIVEHLFKYAIEAISIVCPGHRFFYLSKPNSQSEEIINASKDFMDGLYQTLIGPSLWKLFKTSGYKKLESSHATIYRIMKQHLINVQNVFFNDPNLLKENKPFLYYLQNNNNLSTDDKVMLAMEIFLGGIDTTATTTALTLYFLSQNKEIQEEARRVAFTNNLKYIKACIKETLRLMPTAGANSRFLARDTEIGEYLIPKNTLISAFSSVTSCDEKYFHNAHEYYPNRWLRESKESFHRFASLPFGYGPRMCPGKRLAENEMTFLLQKILQNFKFELAGEVKVGMVYRMNRIPDKPINIKFINTNY